MFSKILTNINSYVKVHHSMTFFFLYYTISAWKPIWWLYNAPGRITINKLFYTLLNSCIQYSNLVSKNVDNICFRKVNFKHDHAHQLIASCTRVALSNVQFLCHRWTFQLIFRKSDFTYYPTITQKFHTELTTVAMCK